MTKVVHGNGIKAVQTHTKPINHIYLVKDGRMVLHAPIRFEMTERALMKLIKLYITIFETRGGNES